MLPHLTGRSVGTDGVIFVGREICSNLQESLSASSAAQFSLLLICLCLLLLYFFAQAVFPACTVLFRRKPLIPHNNTHEDKAPIVCAVKMWSGFLYFGYGADEVREGQS